MMDPYELHEELLILLQQFRMQLANSGTGELSEKGSRDIGPAGTKAHEQASALLETLQSDAFEEVLP